jgi:hypothetical protein
MALRSLWGWFRGAGGGAERGGWGWWRRGGRRWWRRGAGGTHTQHSRTHGLVCVATTQFLFSLSLPLSPSLSRTPRTHTRARARTHTHTHAHTHMYAGTVGCRAGVCRQVFNKQRTGTRRGSLQCLCLCPLWRRWEPNPIDSLILEPQPYPRSTNLSNPYPRTSTLS